MAAYTCGIDTVLIPADNVKDLEKIDKEARAHLRFVPCTTAREVIDHALVLPAAKKRSAAKLRAARESSAAKSAQTHGV